VRLAADVHVLRADQEIGHAVGVQVAGRGHGAAEALQEALVVDDGRDFRRQPGRQGLEIYDAREVRPAVEEKGRLVLAQPAPEEEVGEGVPVDVPEASGLPPLGEERQAREDDDVLAELLRVGQVEDRGQVRASKDQVEPPRIERVRRDSEVVVAVSVEIAGGNEVVSDPTPAGFIGSLDDSQDDGPRDALAHRCQVHARGERAGVGQDKHDARIRPADGR
jgi:hypothetical protein